MTVHSVVNEETQETVYLSDRWVLWPMMRDGKGRPFPGQQLGFGMGFMPFFRSQEEADQYEVNYEAAKAGKPLAEFRREKEPSKLVTPSQFASEKAKRRRERGGI